MSTSSLSQLIQERRLWCAQHQNPPAQGSPGTGFAVLDAALHLGGWPRDGSTELCANALGIGELWLLLPGLSQRCLEAPLAWVNPPCLPNPDALAHHGLPANRQLLVRPPRLAEQLWATEELLRSGAFSVVLSWFSSATLQDRQLRRLHLAAREGRCWHLHFRSLDNAQQSSPAPLRLTLQPEEQALQINIIKQPGGPAGAELLLSRPRNLYWQQRPVNLWPSFTSRDISPARISPSIRLMLPRPMPGPQPEPQPEQRETG